MKILQLSLGQKLLIVFCCFLVAVAGFMVKLPSGLHNYDKQLHAAFYFMAAAFLNALFAGTNLLKHAVIFFILYAFGVGIEYAQDYSNKFFSSPIHGRYDPEDVKWNVRGLLAFSACWVVCTTCIIIYKSLRNTKATAQP